MRWSGRVAAVTMTVGALAAAQAMAAPPEWTPTQTQPLGGTAGFGTESVAPVVGGGATVGLSRDTPTGREAAVIERASATDQWGAPVSLSGSGRIDLGPFVARNRRGDAVAVWGVSGEPALAAVRYGGSWSRAVTLKAVVPVLRGSDVPSDLVKVRIGTDRRAVVAVAQCTPRGCALHVDTATPRAKRAWTDRVAVAVPRSGVASLGWDLGQGEVVAAWRVGGGIRAAEVAVGSTRPVVPVRVPSGDASGRLSVALGPGGARAVAWTTARGGMGSSVRLPEDIGWRPARRVARDAGAGAPRVAVGCDGGVVGAWVQPGPTAGIIKQSTAQGTHGLATDPKEVSTYGDATKALSVSGVAVVGRTGLTMVTWQRAQNGGSAAAGQLQGDRGQYAVRGFGFDGAFRAGPAPAFADDGTGLLVATTDTGLQFQQFTPGPDVIACG